MSKKILVADDDGAILDAVKIMLEMCGYEVITTQDGRTIDVMLEESPDVLLLDIWMSGIDGRTICKHLKQIDKTKNIPIIMVSASKDVSISARDAGADDFLAKPFEMNDLLALVEKYS